MIYLLVLFKIYHFYIISITHKTKYILLIKIYLLVLFKIYHFYNIIIITLKNIIKL
jgi:hypothetical protein